MSKQRVVVACPSWGVAPPEAIESRMNVAYHLGVWSQQEDCPYEFSTATMPDLLVQYSRETLCREAVDKGFDIIVMVDDDMHVPYDFVDRLLLDDVDIVAPLAFTRMRPHLPVLYGEHPVSGETYFVRNYPKNQLVECHAVGFGAVCIKVDVLRRMKQPWFFTMAGSAGTGEDIWFCKEARRQTGARVWCDTRVKLLHLGPRRYVGEEDFERENPEAADMQRELGAWSIHKAKEGLRA